MDQPASSHDFLTIASADRKYRPPCNAVRPMYAILAGMFAPVTKVALWGGMGSSYKRHFGTVLRYGLVGMTQNAIAYGVALLLIWAGAKAWQATAILYPIATILSYFAHRSISFRSEQSAGQFTRYVALYVGMYGVAVASNALLEWSGIPAWMAVLLTTFGTAAALFAGMRWWVFANHVA